MESNKPIRVALVKGHTEVVRLLASIPGVVLKTIEYYMQRHGRFNLDKLARMTYAISTNNNGLIENEDLLVWSAMFGSIPLVQELIKQGVDPTFADNTAVATAEQFGQEEMVAYLLTLPGVHL